MKKIDLRMAQVRRGGNRKKVLISLAVPVYEVAQARADSLGLPVATWAAQVVAGHLAGLERDGKAVR